MLAELDNCGAKRCSHVADEIASHIEKVETFKPELVSKMPQKGAKNKEFVLGPVEPREHDVERLRTMLNRKDEPEEEKWNVRPYHLTDHDEKLNKKSKIELDI